MRDSSPDDDTSPEAKLWSLVEARGRPGADRDAIDRDIWARFGDRMAVVVTDLAGFSRRVAEFGVVHFLQVIHAKRTLLLPLVAAHGGHLVKAEADSFLLLFRDPARALACSVAMRRACEAANVGRAPEEQLLLCQGIGYGDVLRVGEHEVWGREVNAASKLGEDTAKAGDILVTQAWVDAMDALPAGAALEPVAAVAGSEVNHRLVLAG